MISKYVLTVSYILYYVRSRKKCRYRSCI